MTLGGTLGVGTLSATSKAGSLYSIQLENGEIAGTPLVGLFAACIASKVSGRLEFTTASTRKTLWFTEGNIVGSASNLREDSLGKLLLSWGKISPRVHALLNQPAQDDLPEGQRLIRHGALDARGLKQALREQTIWRIIGLSAWRQGRYHFAPSPVSPRIEPITAEELLLYAVEGNFGKRYLNMAAESLGDCVPKTASQTPFLHLACAIPSFALLLSRVNGKLPFRGLADMDSPRRFWLRVFALHELGCLSFELPSAESVQSRLERLAEKAFSEGKMHLQAQNLTAAEACFVKSVALQPTREDYLCRLAWTRILRDPNNLATVDQNLPLLEQAVWWTPENADYHFFYACALLRLGHLSKSKAEFEHVLALSPSDMGARQILGRWPA